MDNDLLVIIGYKKCVEKNNNKRATTDLVIFMYKVLRVYHFYDFFFFLCDFSNPARVLAATDPGIQ